jgi:hypothetical protein
VPAEKIGYGQSKRLTAELGCRRHIDRLGGRIGIDRAGIRGRRAHPIATIALRGARDIALEARDARDDDLVTIGLEYAIAQPAAEREGRDTEGSEQEFGGPPTTRRGEQESRKPPLILRCGWRLPGTRWPTRCRRARACGHPAPVSILRPSISVHDAQNSRSGGQLGWFAV